MDPGIEEVRRVESVPFRRRTGVAVERCLIAAALVIVLFHVYCWMVRIGNDLAWDEVLNRKTYARHPLTAVGLYREPNNHPLESLFKSIFHGVLGLDAPAFAKLPGFVLVACWLVLLARWSRCLAQRDALALALLSGVVFVSASGIHGQAMNLRGYFLSMVLELAWISWLARDARLLDNAPPGALDRARLARYAVLSALLLFTVPSNFLVLCALWPATVLAYRGRPEAAFAKPVARLALASLGAAALLWTPILLGLALGVSRFHSVSHASPESFLEGAREGLMARARDAIPPGAPVLAAAVIAGVAVLGAACLVRRRRLAAVGFCLFFGSLLPAVLAAGLSTYPDRVNSPLAVTVCAGVLFMLQSLIAFLPRGLALTIAAALLLAVFSCLPEVAAQERLHRQVSELAAFLETYTRPAERRVVVAHDDLQPLLPPFHRAFGAEYVWDGRVEMVESLDGAPPAGAPGPAWTRSLQETLFPRRPAAVLDPAQVDVLVMIHYDLRGRGPLDWRHPALDALKERLALQNTWRRDGFTVVVWEKP